MEESRDLHADAMREALDSLPVLEEIGYERRGEVDTDEIDRFNDHRRGVLAKMGYGVGGLATRGLLAGGFGGLLAGMLATPAHADTPLDVQILQTASSLEALAIATYGVALGEGPMGADAPAAKAVAGIAVKSAKDTVAAFAKETQRQHTEHKKAFQAQTTALDKNAKVQDSPNPKFLPAVMGADLSTPDKLVDFAALLEKVATDTYLLNLTLLQDVRSKSIMGSVMAVECQHLATLRAVGALLKGGAPQLIAVPFPAASIKDLPAAAGSVAFPDAIHKVNSADLIAEPTSGAVK